MYLRCLALWPTCGTLFSLRGCLSQPNVKVCARSYCILLWYAQLMFLRLLFFSRGRQGRGDLGREGVGELAGVEEGKPQSGYSV